MDVLALLLPGKHGDPSMWHFMIDGGRDSLDLTPLILIAIGNALLCWPWSSYIRAAYPPDESIHCDKSVLVVSRAAWFDFKNRTMKSKTYPLGQVSGLRYATIASNWGASIRGIRFSSQGRRWMLPEIEPEEAKKVLSGLRALGADAPEDPKLDKLIAEAAYMRGGDTGWMDRSWMDSDNKQ